MTSPWTDLENLDAAKMYARTTALIAPMQAQLATLGYISDSGFVTTPVTLATAGTAVASTMTSTVVLNQQTRIRCDLMAQFNTVSGAPTRFTTHCAYNTGASVNIGTATQFGFFGATVNPAAGSSGQQSVYTFGQLLLAAGTYTFFGALNRVSGGSATDTMQSGQLIITGFGNV